MKQPAIYFPHGGGPWHVMEGSPFAPNASYAPLRKYLEDLPGSLPAPPKAVLMVSAHWEAKVPTLQGAAQPGMLYDYGGFPPHTYKIQWPAPGAPELAAQVQDLLRSAGLASAVEPTRGFDHGTFVPMMVAWPKADIPTLQISLIQGLDPKAHLELGRALAPLREQGVLILGSGLSFHNLRMFGRPEASTHSQRFDAWIHSLAPMSAEKRWAALTHWKRAPSALESHPREEHLLPLMVVAGAGEDAAVQVSYSNEIMGFRVSALHFG